MTDFTDRLTLLIEANANGALNVIKGFGSQTQGELAKVEAAAGTSGTKAGESFGKNLSNQTLLAVAGLQAAFGTLGVGLFAKSAAQDAVSLQRATAGLTAELSVNGATAGVTAAEIDRLATSIQKSDAIYAGATKQAAGLLLTYNTIKNVAGAGNDIFSRTLQVAADLSNVAPQVGSITQAVTTLGKALEDPEAGFMALKRAGIALDAQLQTQIKTLQDNGDLLGAQKALLDDLERRYSAAGKAIAAADPFQQFNVSLTEFKTKIGQDLLPALSVILKGFSDILGVVEQLPGPVRALAEAFIAVTLVAAPLLKVKQILDAMTASEGEATAATTALSTSFTLLGVAIAGVAIGDVVGNKINQALAGPQQDVGQLAKSFEALGQSGTIVGTAMAEVGDGAKKLAGDLHTIEGSTVEKAFGFAPSAHRAVADIKSVNDAMIQLLNTSGPDAATRAFGNLAGALEKDGVSAEVIGTQFEPFLNALTDATAAAKNTTNATDDLTAGLGGLNSAAAEESAIFSIADAFDSVTAAAQKLQNDQATAAGTSQDAIQANKDVADAIRGVADADQALADANQKATDSVVALHQAQKALDDYNSARSQEERNLQLDIIRRRVVTTPAEYEQKQLDLLQTEDRNAQQHQQLQDAVTSAQRNVQDAERGVADATQKVADAEDKVREATLKRQQVHDQAAAAIQTDERKVQEAIAGVIGAIDKAATDPNLDIPKTQIRDWATELEGIIQLYGGPLTDAVKKFYDLFDRPAYLSPSFVGPRTADEQRLFQEAQGTFNGPISSQDAALLHNWGVPGFATGGIVPGARGVPRLAVVHGGEQVLTPEQQGGVTIHQTNTFHGDTDRADLDYTNRELGWLLARTGR